MEKIKFYGSESETAVEISGRVYLIQSPDFPLEKKWELLSDLPEEFKLLNPAHCWDLQVPACLLTEDICEELLEHYTDLLRTMEQQDEIDCG